MKNNKTEKREKLKQNRMTFRVTFHCVSVCSLCLSIRLLPCVCVYLLCVSVCLCLSALCVCVCMVCLSVFFCVAVCLCVRGPVCHHSKSEGSLALSACPSGRGRLQQMLEARDKMDSPPQRAACLAPFNGGSLKC